MTNSTQNDQIFAYLQTGRSLTALEAFQRFKTLRLAARIHDLRSAIQIESRKVKRGGKWLAVYRLSN